MKRLQNPIVFVPDERSDKSAVVVAALGLEFLHRDSNIGGAGFFLGAFSLRQKVQERNTRSRCVEVLSQAASRTHQTVSNKIIIHRAEGVIYAWLGQSRRLQLFFFSCGLPNADASFETHSRKIKARSLKMNKAAVVKNGESKSGCVLALKYIYFSVIKFYCPLAFDIILDHALCKFYARALFLLCIFINSLLTFMLV